MWSREFKNKKACDFDIMQTQKKSKTSFSQINSNIIFNVFYLVSPRVAG